MYGLRNLLTLSAAALIAAPVACLAGALSAAGWPLEQFKVDGVTLRESFYKGSPAVEIRMPSEKFQDASKEKLTDRSFMAWLPIDFRDGVIEVDIASELTPDAPAYARGFAGVSFRIDSGGRFENIYLRPLNSAAQDQVRRNHSVQYFAYPDFTFDRLRKEEPERFEAYAELLPAQWTRMRIEVNAARAVLYLNGKAQASLLVDGLKLGDEQRGGVGIWIESGTVAYFKDLKILPKN